MSRKSKIARLPRSIRDELNRRLDNGHPGIRLAEWLNGLPEVREVLAREFQGRRITPQNISEWKRGGYQDWLAQQEHTASLQDFLADAKELGEAATPEKLSEAIFNFGLVHYAAALQRSIYRPEHRDTLNRCSQMLNDVIRLRNCDLARERFDLDTQKLAFNAEKLEIQIELARLRLDLDHARLDLARQKVAATENPEGVPAISPGLRRDAGRYPGKPSPEIVSNPERVVSRMDQNLNADKVNSPSAVPQNTEHATRNLQPVAVSPPSPPRSGGEGRGLSRRSAAKADEEALRAQAESSFDVRRLVAPKSDEGGSMFDVRCSNNHPEINPLQPNPTKSNHPFFIFPQTTTGGQASCLSLSSSTSYYEKLPATPKLPQSLNLGITKHEP